MTTTPAHKHRPGNYHRGEARKTIVAAIKATGAQGITYAALHTRYADRFTSDQIKSALQRSTRAGELVNLHAAQAVALYAHRDHAEAARAAAATIAPASANGLTYVTDGPTTGRRYESTRDTYTGAELRPQQNRPAGNDFLACPSRHGNHLIWRDGRQETTT